MNAWPGESSRTRLEAAREGAGKAAGGSLEEKGAGTDDNHSRSGEWRTAQKTALELTVRGRRSVDCIGNTSTLPLLRPVAPPTPPRPFLRARPPAAGHSLAVAVLTALWAKLAGESVAMTAGHIGVACPPRAGPCSRMRRPTPRPGQGLSDQCPDTSKTAAGSTVKGWEARYRAEAAANVLAGGQAADEVAKVLDAGDLNVTRAPRGSHSSSPRRPGISGR